MHRGNHFAIAFVFLAMLTFACRPSEKGEADLVGSSDYADLVSLFKEFREFQKPKITNGVPDYTAPAMEEQRRGLKKFQSRLGAIAISGWPVSQQIDYHLVRAEMNGLDFDHRILRSWSRDPGFYITVRFKYGPTMYGSLRIPKLPVTADGIAEFRMKLQAVPKILTQAKGNLNVTEVPGDLAICAIREKKKESAIFADLATRLAEFHPDLVADAERAKAACDDFREWLEENKSKMTMPAGIGKENFNWWLKNVHLFPYTWKECLDISQREYERTIAFLKLEENRNRKLSRLEPAAKEAEYRDRYDEGEQHLLNFLREEEVLTVPDYLVPSGARPWATVPDRHSGVPYYPKGGFRVREFFRQTEDRDPVPLQCHNVAGHRFDSLRSQRDNRPIRGVRRLYLIDDMIRGEAVATGFEEMLMHAGLLDKRRRAREITYIMIAFRAARSIAELKMISNEFTLKDAIEYCVERTPRSWVRKDSWTSEDSHTMWHDMEIPLRHPGSAMGYLMGKNQVEKLLADRAMQLGDKFNLRQFMDEFLAAGMIPIALTQWEMTGLDDGIKKLW